MPHESMAFSPNGSQQIPTRPRVKKKLPNHVSALCWVAFPLQVGEGLALGVTLTCAVLWLEQSNLVPHFPVTAVPWNLIWQHWVFYYTPGIKERKWNENALTTGLKGLCPGQSKNVQQVFKVNDLEYSAILPPCMFIRSSHRFQWKHCFLAQKTMQA